MVLIFLRKRINNQDIKNKNKLEYILIQNITKQISKSVTYIEKNFKKLL
jgi:hypothetical protein